MSEEYTQKVPNLGGLFAKDSQTTEETPARGKALGGIIGKKKPTPPAEHTASAPDPVVVQEPEGRVEDVLPDELRAPRRSAAAQARNVAVWMPPKLLLQMRRFSKRMKITYADVLVLATEDLDEDQVRARLNQAVPASGSGMPRVAQQRRRGTKGQQVQFRLRDEQIAWLHDLQKRVDAPNRSALVCDLIEQYLSDMS